MAAPRGREIEVSYAANCGEIRVGDGDGTWAERIVGKDKAGGSSPPVGSKFNSEKLDRVVVWQLLFVRRLHSKIAAPRRSPVETSISVRPRLHLGILRRVGAFQQWLFKTNPELIEATLFHEVQRAAVTHLEELIGQLRGATGGRN